MDNTELGQRIESLESKALALHSKLESDPSPEAQRDVKAQLTALQEQLQPLTDARENALLQEGMRDMKAQIGTLEGALKDLRKPMGFEFAGGIPVSQSADEYDGSFFADVKAANRGNHEARSRMAKAVGASEDDLKAMTEGSDAGGGYLVPTQRLDGILDLKVQEPRLLNIFPKLTINGDTIEIATVTAGMTAGWVAELANKPASDLAFGQISASVFTAAGLGVVSNQLLRDSRKNGKSVDEFILRDLRRRLGRLYEIALLNGSGVGQPLGILQTLGTQPLPFAVWGDDELLDAAIDMIMMLETEGFQATHFIMHPRRWQRIAKFRDANTKELIINGGRPSGGLPSRSLYGVPVILTNTVPTNLGAGTEDAIIALDASEQLLLENQGITVDESEHVYFTSNQTVFRMEERVGATFGRYPKSIVVAGGAGLAA